jgi:hypothetical protein
MSILSKLIGLGAGRATQAVSRILPASEERILGNLMRSAPNIMKERGGFSFDPRTGRFLQPGSQSGFMMGTLPNNPALAPVQAGGGVARNITELIDVAKQPNVLPRLKRGEYIGGWDEGYGMGLDPARRHLTKFGAIRSGLRTNQAAGFDLRKGETFDVTREALLREGAKLAAGATTVGGAGTLAMPQGRDFLSGLIGREESPVVESRPQIYNASFQPGLVDKAAPAVMQSIKKGKIGKEFTDFQSKIFGNLFTEKGTPIAPANASKILQDALALSRKEKISVEDAMKRIDMEDLSSAETDVIRTGNPQFLLDPNAPTENIRLFQNPVNPSASSAQRAGGIINKSIVRQTKEGPFLTIPSKKELELGKGIRLIEYPAEEYARIAPGALPKYVKNNVNKRGEFGLILDDISNFGTTTTKDGVVKTKTVIPLEQLKNPETREILKARAVENLVRVALSSTARTRMAGLYWYPRAGEVARMFDNPKQMSDVMAAMSPSMPWAANIDAAVALKTLHQNGLLDDLLESISKYTIAMPNMSKAQQNKIEKQILKEVQNRLLAFPDISIQVGFLTPKNALKALNILKHPELGDNILGELKTRNFSSNIMNQVTSPGTTIDVHAVDALVGAKFAGINRGLGSKERYNFGMEVMREAADALGVPPAALQAIDWVTWKSFVREAL